MRNKSFHLAAACFILLSTHDYGYGAANAQPTRTPDLAPQLATTSISTPPPSAPNLAQNYQAFTGKVTKNKVRLRLQPNLDGPIIREMNRGDMMIISGETDGFYAVQPPSGTKAYVFRTFILDNVVEGTKVNIRLEPDLESPIIGQLNSGDKIQGTISPVNSKWLEINSPESTRFYVAKDYVEKIGDSTMMATITRRRNEVNDMLDNAYKMGQNELQKPYEEIHLEAALLNFNKVATQYTDFPDQAARAKELQKTMQDAYLQKKIRYLETKSKLATEAWQNKNQQLAAEMQTQQQRLSDMEQKLKQNKTGTDTGNKTVPNDNMQAAPSGTETPSNEGPDVTVPDYAVLSEPITAKMAVWNPHEEALYQSWKKHQPDASMSDFYEEQKQDAVVLKGVVEVYNRGIKNKPGDFILVNRSSSLPIAFMYSTKVNLQDKIGQELNLIAVPRPNNNFAFPAYYIISIE